MNIMAEKGRSRANKANKANQSGPAPAPTGRLAAYAVHGAGHEK